MKNAFDDDEHPFGLIDAVVGMTTTIPQLDRSVGHGLAVRPPVDLEALFHQNFEGAVFLHARRPELEEVGLSLHLLDNSRQVLKVSSLDGEELDVLGSQAERVWFDPDDPGTVYLQMEQQIQSVVRQSSRSGVAIDGSAQTLTQLFLPLNQEPCAPIDSPVEQWVVGDRWLLQRVQQLVRGEHALRHVFAVGLAKRLADLSSDAKTIAAQILAGDRVDLLSRPHLWMQQLAPAQLRTVERLACAQAQALTAGLASILTEPDRPLSGQLLRERDDLEGVVVLLREVRAAQRLEAKLRVVDTMGIDFVRAGKIVEGADDEQLLRAARLDPLAWWGASQVTPP